MSEPLPRAQQETLNIIRRYARNGTSPTFREIASERDVAVNAVAQCVRALARKGFVTLGGGKSRGIRLTEPSPLERAIKLLKAGVGANPEDIDAFLKETST
jgi:Mn-dependent DtxR family transcriptional regulator